ncbi:MAG: hypothetical protein M1814_005930 [Vezdaea aestivalis]|nr:MAG: hypothetical protein M1814_005930 [Vezdaea aestivalis]
MAVSEPPGTFVLPSEQFGSLDLSDSQTANPSSESSPRPVKAKAAPLQSPRLPKRSGPPKSDEEQRQMFAELEAIFQQAEDAQGGVGVSELRPNPEYDDDEKEQAGSRKNVQALRETRQILDQMWWSGSSYMARAAEIMADASRDRMFKNPIRLARQFVISNNYLSHLAKHINDTELAQVAVPVVHNICVDYEPAQEAAVESGVASILINRLAGSRDVFNNSPFLLGYVCRLLDLITSFAGGLDSSPENAVQVLLEYSSHLDLDLDDYVVLVNSAVNHLRNERFQQASLAASTLETPLAVLVDSYERFDEPSTPLPLLSSLDISSQASANPSPPPPVEETQLSQLRNNLVQVFSDVSALTEFPTAYPLDSPLIGSLRLWLTLPQRELLICGCIMLGNLARSDAVCQTMVQSYSLHTLLVDIISRTSDPQLLHAAMGFLKNLSLPFSNKQIIGIASLIPTLSRIWALNTLPHIQLASTSLARIVLTGSEANTLRVLASLSNDPDSPAYSRTYLSLLLSLFHRSDDLATRMEIARLVVAILRVLNKIASDPEPEVGTRGKDLQRRLFALHQDIARPLSTMVLQDRWPVVRSEGWFAFALMSRTVEGAECVTEVLVESKMFEPLIETVVGKVEGNGETGQSEGADQGSEMRKKDRENALVCASELLRHKGTFLTPERRQVFEDLLHGKQPSGLDENVRFG